MEFIKTKFDNVWLIKPIVHSDARGFFLESYSLQEFQKLCISPNFVQDNHSMSMETGVLRGLHFQNQPMAQSKLVRTIRGSVFDVVVDLRKNSSSFGQWQGFELTESNFLMLFIPQGFAHGFCTLSPQTEFLYKVDNYYSPEHDSGLRWNDPTIGIQWPIKDPVLSEKDKKLPYLKDSKFSL
jgi:dTDP-4-dehydrorhamnose 3,5-epimerase